MTKISLGMKNEQKCPSESTLFVLFSDTGTKTDTDADTDTDTDTWSDTARLLRRLTPRVFFCRFISTQDYNEGDVPVAIWYEWTLGLFRPRENN